MNTKLANASSPSVSIAPAADIDLSTEALTGRTQTANLETPQEVLISGVGALGEMAERAGIRPGATFKVVVPRGAVGFQEIDSPQPVTPGTDSSSLFGNAAFNSFERPQQTSEAAEELIAGVGTVGQLAAQNGIPLGSNFKVVTSKGKTGFARV